MHRPALLCKLGNGHSSIGQLKQYVSNQSANYEPGGRRFDKRRRRAERPQAVNPSGRANSIKISKIEDILGVFSTRCCPALYYPCLYQINKLSPR